MEKLKKHFRFSPTDQDNLNIVKKANDCFSENSAIRAALKIAAETGEEK